MREPLGGETTTFSYTGLMITYSPSLYPRSSLQELCTSSRPILSQHIAYKCEFRLDQEVFVWLQCEP